MKSLREMLKDVAAVFTQAAKTMQSAATVFTNLPPERSLELFDLLLGSMGGARWSAARERGMIGVGAEEPRYCDAVVTNLLALLPVAALAPRLAVVGVYSELEVMIKECMPRAIMDDRIARHALPPALAATAVAQRVIFDIAQYLPSDLKEFPGWIVETAAKYRHNRGTVSPRLDLPPMTFGTASQAVEKAIRMVDFLSSSDRATLGYMECACGRHYVTFADVIGMRCGTYVWMRCPGCGDRWPWVDLQRAYVILETG